ncbi:hypothetical protein MMC13_005304 [Lambiella insularis]|nr:hypothetical protein [Lambiella insularis]
MTYFFDLYPKQNSPINAMAEALVALGLKLTSLVYNWVFFVCPIVRRRHGRNGDTRHKGPTRSKLVDLPVDILSMIVANIEGPRSSNLAALRLTTRKLLPYTSDMMFGEAHLFLHPQSFAKIEHLAELINKLVIWIPVFSEPQRARDYYGYMGYSSALSQIWALYDMGSPPDAVHLARVNTALYPNDHLGHIATAYHHLLPCRETESNQWPNSDVLLPDLMRFLLPKLSEGGKIVVQKYAIRRDDFDTFSYWSEEPIQSTQFRRSTRY